MIFITLKNKNIVVTGGAGFIGSNLAEYLSKDNNVYIIDNLLTSKESNLAGFPATFYNHSITDLEFLEEKLSDMDLVFHQAALPSVPRSIKDPIASNLNNIEGTLKILLASYHQKVKKVVAISSSSVYGDTPTLPKEESMPSNPLSPYAITKLTSELYTKQFYTLYNLPTVSLRYFNIFGPKQNPKSQYTGVISKFFMSALNDEPLIILGDGEQSRDFTYVMDAIQANIKAVLSDKADGMVLNIAKGVRTTINELAQIIIDISGSNSIIKHDKPRTGDIRHSLADISRAKQLIGYDPKFTLRDGLKLTYEWFKQMLNTK